jgi:hypothetical protein
MMCNIILHSLYAINMARIHRTYSLYTVYDNTTMYRYCHSVVPIDTNRRWYHDPIVQLLFSAGFHTLFLIETTSWHTLNVVNT